MSPCFFYNSVRRIIIVFVIMQFLFACSGPSQENQNKQEKKPEKSTVIYNKPPSSFNDTIVIDTRSAVFYNPDSLQLKNIKTVIANNEYETEIHNCFYLMRNARAVMKQYWPQIHVIEISRARYFLFIKKNKNKVVIDLNTKNDMCGMFLFDRKKDPELIDMMNIDTALEFYFNK